MAGINGLVLVVFLISAMAFGCHGLEKRPFSSLKNSLIVTTNLQAEGAVLKAGVDTITVSWALNSSATSETDAYKTVKVKLCYAPPSQVDRPWRKTVADNIAKDKTCQFLVVSKPYSPSNNTETYTIKKDVPGAIYFIRAYVFDATDKEVAYGQTSADKKTNLFTIVGITGRTSAASVRPSVCVLDVSDFKVCSKEVCESLDQNGLHN